MSAQEYTAPLVQQARRYADAGFNASEIQRMLRDEHGQAPSHHTIRTWIDADCLARKRDRIRRWQEKNRTTASKFRLPSQTLAYQEAFIRRLRTEGVPCASIAKVCNVLFDSRWSEFQVRQIVKGTP